MRNRNAQAWGTDLIVASLIFIGGIVVFYFYSMNYSGETETRDKMNYEGEIFSESILSSGYPEDWNSSNVIKIGILSDNQLNETKLSEFYNLANSEYSRTRALFKIDENYYFFLSEPMIINSEEIEGIGRVPVNDDNLVKITRLTVYKEKPTSVYIYIWK